MKSRKLVAVGGMVTLLALVAGCSSTIAGSASTRSASASPAVVTATVTATASPAAAATTVVTHTATQTETAPPATSAPPVRTEATSSASSDAFIRSEVAGAVSVVDRYWQELFSTWYDDYGNPVTWWSPQMYHGDGFYDSALGIPGPLCHGKSVGPENASFCPEGYGASGFGTISWDMELFRPFAADNNDAVYYMVVAHENAHAAQIRFIFDGEGPAVFDDTSVAEETQADCIAGATLAKAGRDGYLTFDDGDDAEIRAVMVKFGDYENDHGTPGQRYAAFEEGYQSADIESCLGQR